MKPAVGTLGELKCQKGSRKNQMKHIYNGVEYQNWVDRNIPGLELLFRRTVNPKIKPGDKRSRKSYFYKKQLTKVKYNPF